MSEDTTAKSYNRIAKGKKPIGYVFRRNGTAPLAKDYAKVEDILERYKPTEKLSRNEAVNMRDDRNFSMMGIDAYDEGYVHQVQPLGDVTEHDVEWIGALQRRYPKSGMPIKEKYADLSDQELAENYWNGVKSKFPSMEFHATEATVINVDDQPLAVRPSAMEEALRMVRAYDCKNDAPV